GHCGGGAVSRLRDRALRRPASPRRPHAKAVTHGIPGRRRVQARKGDRTMTITNCRWMAAAAAVFALATAPAQAAKLTRMSTPGIGCAGATETSTTLQVCGGATGASAGFSVQWMTAADDAANGNAWYTSDDPRLCKASFSGNANLSRYGPGPGECVSVS